MLGVLSGVASSCCAPVLAGVMTLSALSSTLPGSVAPGLAYVFGMVFPPLVMALLWDRLRLGQRRLLTARPRGLRLAGVAVDTSTVNLVVAGASAAMGGLVPYPAASGRPRALRGSSWPWGAGSRRPSSGPSPPWTPSPSRSSAWPCSHRLPCSSWPSSAGRRHLWKEGPVMTARDTLRTGTGCCPRPARPSPAPTVGSVRWCCTSTRAPAATPLSRRWSCSEQGAQPSAEGLTVVPIVVNPPALVQRETARFGLTTPFLIDHRRAGLGGPRRPGDGTSRGSPGAQLRAGGPGRPAAVAEGPSLHVRQRRRPARRPAGSR